MPASRIARQTSNELLATGLALHAADLPSMMVGGQTHTNSELVTTFESLAESSARVLAAHRAYLEVVAADRVLARAQAAFVEDVRTMLRTMYGEKPTILGDFGLAPRRRTALTPEALVARAAKARATREARGTKGPRQRAAIHGDVTGVTITPVVGEAAAPAAEPAAGPRGSGTLPRP